MQRTIIRYNYRKCFKCGAITEDINKDKCKCGSYMHIIGSYYQERKVKAQ